MPPRAIAGQAAPGQHILHPLPEDLIEQRFVFSVVEHASDDNHPFVVGVGQHAVQLAGVDRFADQLAGGAGVLARNVRAVVVPAGHTVRMVDLPNDPELVAAVRSVDLGAPELEGLGAEPEHLVITPVRRLESGVGVYPAETVFLAKELRAEGLRVTYLDPPERRTFEVHESAVADLVMVGLSIPGALATNTAWFYIARLLSRAQPAGSSTADTDLEITVTDPLAPPESNQLILRGKPDVVRRIAREIAGGRSPQPQPPTNDSDASS